jgi:hypothetical protein
MEVLIHNRSHERKVTDMIVEWFEELVAILGSFETYCSRHEY